MGGATSQPPRAGDGAELIAEAKQQAQERQGQEDEEAQVKAAVAEMNNIRAAHTDDSDDDEPKGPPCVVTPEPMPEHQVPTGSDGAPTEKAQRNFTDPQSRIMKTADGFAQGYNAQAVVDEEHQIIVAIDVSNQSPDAEHFIPMLDRAIANCGAVPEKLSADTGYFSAANVQRASCRGVDPYVAIKRAKHGAKEPEETDAKDDSCKAQMRAKLLTEQGAQIYSRRKVIVEPAFGQIKNRGFRGFLMRGIEKVRGEWSLITLTHNLLKLHRVCVAA